MSDLDASMLLRPSILDEPYDFYRALRTQAPVHRRCVYRAAALLPHTHREHMTVVSRCLLGEPDACPAILDAMRHNKSDLT